MPSEGRFLTDGGRFYFDDLPYCEVLEAVGVSPQVHAERRKLLRTTSVIEAASKGPWMTRWQIATALEHYRLNAERFEGMDPKDVTTECALQADLIRDLKGDRGTLFHTLVEGLVWGKKIPKQLRDLHPQYDRIMEFIEGWEPEPIHTEIVVMDPLLGVGGQLDFYGRLKGLGVAVADYKTSKRLHEGSILKQEAFYDHHRYWIEKVGPHKYERRMPLPRAESYVALHFPNAETFGVHSLDPVNAHRELAYEAFCGLVPEAKLREIPRKELISSKLKPGHEDPVIKMRSHLLERIAWLDREAPDALEEAFGLIPDEIPMEVSSMTREHVVVVLECLTIAEAKKEAPFGPVPSAEIRELRKALVGE